MKRWEQFNEMTQSNDSLEVQIADMYGERMYGENNNRMNPNIDKQALYDSIKEFLEEEV